ncbi:MAG: hypothetical protein F4135_05060, partial [Acidimicrobiia bacterium]|nr:hypothetical protein [Acidimicrobiia bacterium]
MTFPFLGPDPLEKQISEALRLLSAGRSPAEIETTPVEIKAEAGRRRGAVGVGGWDTTEQAASYLAGEMACLSNTE